MPLALIIALAASLGAHALVLFGPEVELPFGSEPPPLIAELRPPVKPEPEVETPTQVRTPAESPAKPRSIATHSTPARRKAAVARRPLPSPVDSPVTEPVAADDTGASGESVVSSADQAPDEAAPTPETAAPVAVQSSLPARGKIHYRVDRGDQGFMIGSSTTAWEVVDGQYRITAVTETNGIVALFRPLRIEAASRGRITASGLVPERFETRRKDRERGELIEFDWDNRQLRIAGRPAQDLRPGAQDLLSFPLQLGLLGDLAGSASLSIVTGKKYADYRLEILADETISVPAGSFRCLHLRVPGVATTELWLARERSLLPVKVSYVDRKGDLFVQFATAIETSPPQ